MIRSSSLTSGLELAGGSVFCADVQAIPVSGRIPDLIKAQALYRLVNIEIWGRLFFMGQSVDDVTGLLLQE